MLNVEKRELKWKAPRARLHSCHICSGLSCLFLESEHTQGIFFLSSPSTILHAEASTGLGEWGWQGGGGEGGQSFLPESCGQFGQPTLWLPHKSPIPFPPLRDGINSVEYAFLSRQISFVRPVYFKARSQVCPNSIKEHQEPHTVDWESREGRRRELK